MNPNDVHVDAVLTNLAVEFAAPGFCADKLFPFINVNKESDKYYKFVAREELRSERQRSRRAPGDPAHEIVWTGTTDLYSCEEYAFRNLLPDRIRDNADAPVRPRARVTRKITAKLWLGLEEAVQALAQDRVNITGADVTNNWDTTNGDPESDIDAGKEAMKRACGQKPTHMVLSGPVTRALRRKLKAKAAGITLREVYEFNELPPVVYGLRPIIAESIHDTSIMGQAMTIADIWNDDVVLAYVDPDPGLDSFTFGLTFRRQDLVIKSWRNEERRGEMQEGSWVLDPKRIVPEAAYLLKGALS